jgi:general secretion pathway protein D
MIAHPSPYWIQYMKRICLLIALMLGLVQVRVLAQESAAGDQAGAPSNAPNPSGLLTPPPDNSTGAATPATTQTTATTTETPTETTTPSPPKEMTRAEIARIQQQAIIRRQELIFRANEALATGRRNELAAEYPEARSNYLFAAEAFGSISRSTTSYAESAEGLTRVDFQIYDSALKVGDMGRAKEMIDEVIKYNPNNKLANEKLTAINRALANPNDTSLLGNPAITPGLVKKVDDIQDLLAQAEQYRRTGQWDLAEERLKRILGIDPYNIAATKQLERIDAEKYAYDETARLEMRDERLRQLEEKWYEPITNKSLENSAQEAQPTIIRATNFDIDEKLKSIFISLDFNNATIEEATDFLSTESKRLDPDHKGANFIIDSTASSSAKPITLTLNNVPLGEALRYVCQLANVKFKVQDYAISIVPFSQSTDDLISRTFIVQPNFVAPPSASGTIGSATANFGLSGGAAARPIAAPTPAAGAAALEGAGDTVRQALEAKGLKFPPGASAVYTPATGQLTVVDTADQMELLEELVNAGQAPTLMVRIATKFVEINQTDLNDLTFNAAFNLPGVLFPGALSGSLISGTTYATALPGSLGFTPDSIDNLITPEVSTPASFNSLYFKAFLSGTQYNAVINALSQKTSMDVLSEPAVLTKSGDQGVLEAVRVFPYPIAFDPPELQTITSNAAGASLAVTIAPPAVIATTPTDFKRRNVGVRLVVKPQVTADNKTVDLSLFPEVTEFDGFINYGSPIFVTNPVFGGAPPESLLSPNEINQPVFDTRRINTKVLVRDGYTVVLGGLIRDDIQNINDKVPVLGDLPLIGRLFQSKAVENTKRNLIIFVTANIYQNDGELLNPPESVNAADILNGHASYTPPAAP